MGQMGPETQLKRTVRPRRRPGASLHVPPAAPPICASAPDVAGLKRDPFGGETEGIVRASVSGQRV